jgi:hypothetical protein
MKFINEPLTCMVESLNSQQLLAVPGLHVDATHAPFISEYLFWLLTNSLYHSLFCFTVHFVHVPTIYLHYTARIACGTLASLCFNARQSSKCYSILLPSGL